MLINTAAGWRMLLSRPAPELREAATMDERRARMTDELAELCPSISRGRVSVVATLMAQALAGAHV